MKNAYAEGVLARLFLSFFFWLLAMFILDVFIVYIVMLIFNSLCPGCKACSRKDALGILVFNGSVCSFAYLNLKEPISQAVSDIKVLYNQVQAQNLIS